MPSDSGGTGVMPTRSTSSGCTERDTPIGDENIDPSQSKENNGIDLVQRKIIEDIVDRFCPRVVQDSAKREGEWGMFATPEATNEASKDAYEKIPYIKMTIEIVTRAEQEPKYDPIEGQKAAKRYIYLSNSRIRRAVKRKADWNSTVALKSLHDSALAWRSTWAEPENQDAWLETVAAWDNDPKIIHSRTAREHLASIFGDANDQAEQGRLGAPNLDSVEDCVRTVREWNNIHPGDNNWADVHTNLLFSLMINYVPRIRSTRTFLDLANHEQAQTVWPDVHERVNSGPRSHHSMTKTLRNKWGVIGGWLLGAKTKGKQFNFDLSSQIKALQLMKEAKIPWPTKSVKRPTCSSALHRLLDDRIQEKAESLKQTMPLHETNEPGISSQGHMAL